MVNLDSVQAGDRRLWQEIQPGAPKGGEECILSTSRFAVLTANSVGARISSAGPRIGLLPTRFSSDTIQEVIIMTARTTYQWLEPKPYKKFTKQLGIKGRNMIVWNLVADIVVSEHTPEEVAKDFRLPLEAVQEALDYYYANKDWIDAEVDEEGRELGLK
jgi:uncharacterized protein (DUF433 family)